MINRSLATRGLQTHLPSKCLAILCIFLALPLTLSRAFAQSTSAPENSARAVAESAVEFALNDLHHYGTNLVQNGWSLAPGGTNAILERVTGDTKFRLTVSFLHEPPLIRSESWVKSPEQTDFLSRPYTMLAEAIRTPVFGKALASTGDIDLQGYTLRADSYDSSDPNYSTAGQYDPAKNKDNGDIATNSSLLDSVGSAELNIFGRLAVGSEGTYTLGPTGATGSKSWHGAGNTGIEPGWFTSGINVQFKDVRVPFSMGLPPLLSGDGGRVLLSGDYMEVGTLNLSGTSKLIVTGNARLFVHGNVSFTGQSHIEIQPGASLQLFVGGAIAYLGGQGIRNLTGNPRNFVYWGLNTNTHLTLTLSPPFIGAIYAPHAQVRLGSGVDLNSEFKGALVAKAVTVNCHLNLHYDEALAQLGSQTWTPGQTTHPPRRPFAVRIALP